MRSFARQAAGAGRQALLAAGLSVSLCWLSGCSRNEDLIPGMALAAKPSRVMSGYPVSGRSFTVGISLPPKDAFYGAVESGMEKAAADNQVALDIRSAEPVPGNQDRQVQDLISKRVDALVVWCPDGKTAGTAVKEANSAGAPVFTVGAEARRGTVAAHFVPAALVAGNVIDIAPALIGKTLVNKIARYLRGEKLRRYIIIHQRNKVSTK